MSDKWTFVREADGEYTIGKNGVFYNDVVVANVDATIHAVQWAGSAGEIERRDATTGLMTANEAIDSLDGLEFIETAWNTARAAHKADWTADYIEQNSTDTVAVTQADADAAFELAHPA